MALRFSPPWRATLLPFLFGVLLTVAQAGTTVAPDALYIQYGSGAGRGNGDWVSAADTGLNAPYRWYIEVPPNQSNLTVQLYDADTGGGTEDSNLDRIVNGANTTTRYRLFTPTGATQATLSVSNSGTYHNNWQTLATVTNPAAGHWLLEVNTTSSITTGDDANAYGVRAYNSAGSGGTEYNIYSDGYVFYGLHSSSGNRTNVHFPYVTSGCECYARDFDADDQNNSSNSSVDVESRNGAFQPSASILRSDNDVWETSPSAGWTGWSDDGTGVVAGSLSDGYGIWRMVSVADGTSNANNYIFQYVAAFNSPGAPFSGGDSDFEPDSQPEENAFRIYLPRDGSTAANVLAPVKPFLRQQIRGVVSGPNPLDTNQTTVLIIEVEMNNPTSFPITFTGGSRIVTARIPASPVTYAGTASVTQGTILSQPSIGASNANITWNPGIIAAGSSARLSYRLSVRPTSNGQTINLTGTPAANGTRAVFLDETYNSVTLPTPQTRQQFTFGPICELDVQEGSGPLSVDLVNLRATAQPNKPVLVQWTTINEIDNVGFAVYEATLDEKGAATMGSLLTPSLIPADPSGSGEYQWTDSLVWIPGEVRGYYLADIDLVGKVTYHGPTWVTSNTGVTTGVDGWEVYD